MSESAEWREILLGIPGYDPYRDADGCWFDAHTAQLALDFFPECLVHVKGAWATRPFFLEPWQQAVIANLFGWQNKTACRICAGTGIIRVKQGIKWIETCCDVCHGDKQITARRYREALIYVPRKNGKTLMAAGIANLMLFTDGEQGAEIYSAAADRDQASQCFDMARQQVQHDSELSSRAQIYTKRIVRPESNGFYQALSSDAHTKHGSNVHCALIDEVHAHPNAELIDVLVTGTAARIQPLIVYITTADFERKSVCNEKHEYACKVRDGITKNPAFLPVIFEADRDDDWHDPAVWARVNPNLGKSPSLEYMEQKHAQAVDIPRFENQFKRLNLNMKTEQSTRWLPMDKWEACGTDEDAIAWRARIIEEFAGQQCTAGLDLGSTSDLTAFVLLFERDNGKWVVLPYFWTPNEGAIRKQERHGVEYETWIRDGFMWRTGGNVTDYNRVRHDINELGEHHGIREIAIDRDFQGDQMAVQLYNDDGFTVVPFGQGFRSMNAPTKRFEELVLGGQLEHGNNPILWWMASNAHIRTDPAGSIKSEKPEHQSHLKIDGIVATIMALGRAMAIGGPKRSVYEDQGLMVM